MPVKEPIRDILTRRNKSVPWLAGATGYDVAYVYQVTNGHRAASRRFRKACAMVLKVPECELFTTEEVA